MIQRSSGDDCNDEGTKIRAEEAVNFPGRCIVRARLNIEHSTGSLTKLLALDQ